MRERPAGPARGGSSVREGGLSRAGRFQAGPSIPKFGPTRRKVPRCLPGPKRLRYPLPMGVGGTSSTAKWPSFLRGGDSGEILGRIAESDPLRLREATARRLREVWVLLEPDRVFHRALAVVADAVPCEQPPQDMGLWVHQKIDLAIEQLVRKDHEAERSYPEIVDEEDKVFPLLTESFFLEPELVRAASVAFNALDPLPRRAFFELLMEGKQPTDCIEAGPWDEDGLYQAIHQALAAIGLDLHSGPVEEPQPKKGVK